jgi:hypothetical protein
VFHGHGAAAEVTRAEREIASIRAVGKTRP